MTIEQASWVCQEMLSFIDRRPREYLRKQTRRYPCAYHKQLKVETNKACVKLTHQLKRDYIENVLDLHKMIIKNALYSKPLAKLQEQNSETNCIDQEIDPHQIAEL